MMKQALWFLFSMICVTSVHAQSDTSLYENVSIPMEEFAEYHYDSTLQTNILWYNYSDIWDFDGDKLNDSVWFIGNGGAHQYFHLRIVLSSENVWHDYTSIQIDMPYLLNTQNLEELGEKSTIQFAVRDFDSDDIVELYFNVNNPFSGNVDQLETLGISTPYFLIDYSKTGLTFVDY